MIIGSNAVGQFLLPAVSGDEIINAISRGLVYEEPVVQMGRYIRPGSTAIDVGANVGQMSIAYSRIARQVYAVEADPYMAGVLRKNVALNLVDNCMVLEAAAWDVTGERLPYPEPDLKRFESLGSYGVTPDSTSERTVVSVALDDLELQDLSFVKIDAQGSDLRVMQGLRKTIERCRPVIVYEYEPVFDADFHTTEADYDEFVRSIGYEVRETYVNNKLIAPLGY